ncbi:hypothetical protein SLE2022_249100 [Rubroshorea leprosula]
MAAKLMPAVRYDHYGGGTKDLKHVEVPIPTPKKNEILLKVEAISLNPADWKIQQGALRPLCPRKFPHIPGMDVAGEVIEVGSSVKDFKAGDKVVTYLGLRIGGGLAEFVVAKESMTVARPPEVSAADAAGLPIAAITAYEALVDSSGIKLDGSGKLVNVLVTAASGGVGHYAVQLAKLGNAHVTACHLRPSGVKYDIVIHYNTGIPWSTFEPNLSAKGKVIDISPTFIAYLIYIKAKLLTFSKKQLVPMIAHPKRKNLDFLVNLVKEGKLKTVIDSKYPLSKAEDAWDKSIDGHATGKIIVEP